MYCRIPKLRPCSSLHVSKRGSWSWGSVRCACSCHLGDFPSWTQGCAPLLGFEREVLVQRGVKYVYSSLAAYLTQRGQFRRVEQTHKRKAPVMCESTVIQSGQPLGVVLDESGANHLRGRLQKIFCSSLHGNLSFEAREPLDRVGVWVCLDKSTSTPRLGLSSFFFFFYF